MFIDFNSLLVLAVICKAVYWLAHAPERKIERQLNDPIRMARLDQEYKDSLTR